MTLPAGKRDRRVVIQAATQTQNSFGEPVESWSTVTTVWAEVRPISGQMRFTAARELSTEAALFRILYLSTLTERHRLSYNGKAWKIVGLAEIGRRQGWEITAEATE